MPFISIIDTNLSRILFILLMFFAFCVANLAYIGSAGNYAKPTSKVEMCFWGLVGAFWAYFLTWLFMGESVWWSTPIRIWLKG